MDNKEFSMQLEERTKRFAISIIKLSAMFPNTTEGKVVRNQVTKAGTSVGANYREANRGRSRAEFTSKIRICEGESNETVYWLEIIEDLIWVESTFLKSIIDEAIEILAIFTSINTKLKTT